MNILTFDIEEWFHILDLDSTRTEREWFSFESRIYNNMDRLFDILDLSNCRATFFCLGWIAEAYPDIIKGIKARGYEIGTHGRRHQLIYEQSYTEFKNDLEYSIKLLQDLTGDKIKYYRAPGFSIKGDNKWVFEIIATQGIEVDCSIFPAPRSHGGFASFPESVPSIIRCNRVELKELPINYVRLLGIPIIFSGGGYFRFFPYSLLKILTSNSDYTMSYFHPRDFDPNQPIINELSIYRKFKSYYGLEWAETKLNKLLNDFQFVDIGMAIEQIDWESAPVIDI